MLIWFLQDKICREANSRVKAEAATETETRQNGFKVHRAVAGELRQGLSTGVARAGSDELFSEGNIRAGPESPRVSRRQFGLS